MFRRNILKKGAVCFSETFHPPASPHGVKTQKTNVDIITLLIASNLAYGTGTFTSKND
jgi:hypothetical protein